MADLRLLGVGGGGLDDLVQEARGRLHDARLLLLGGQEGQALGRRAGKHAVLLAKRKGGVRDVSPQKERGPTLRTSITSASNAKSAILSDAIFAVVCCGKESAFTVTYSAHASCLPAV